MKWVFKVLLCLIYTQVYSQSIDYNIGDNWIFQYEDYSIGGGNGEVSTSAYEIHDSIYDGVHTKYVLNPQDTFYVENSQMFFWDEYFEEYVMYYDFNSTTQYDIKYYDFSLGSIEIATIVIDSISYKMFGNDSLRVQHVNILNSNTVAPYPEKVYEGIGASTIGIQFLLGCGLCDQIFPTELRCFSTDSMTYKFVDVACDSTWLVSSVNNLLGNEVNLYPNPTTGAVWIDNLNEDVEYQVFSLDGLLLSEGMSIDRYLKINHIGVSIIKLKLDNRWVARRVVRVE